MVIHRFGRAVSAGVALVCLAACDDRYEAFTLPTASMEPTIPAGARIVVDRAAYRDAVPARWDVITFEHPLDKSRNSVKRIVALPGEDIGIAGGDVWVRPTGSKSPLVAVRKPRSVRESLYVPIYPLTPEIAALHPEGGWRDVRTRAPTASGERGVEVLLTPTSDAGLEARSVFAFAVDEAATTSNPVREPGHLPVRDVRVRCGVVAERGASFEVLWYPGDGRRHRLRLEPEGSATSSSASTATREQALSARVAPGNRLGVVFESVDGDLLVTVGGVEASRIADDPPYEDLAKRWPEGVTTERGLWLVARGGTIRVEDVRVDRDIHYTGGETDSDLRPARGETLDVPVASYFVIGDHTRASIDSRSWRARSTGMRDGTRIWYDSATSPHKTSEGGRERSEVIATDGTRRSWAEEDEDPANPYLERRVSFVPRASILGRLQWFLPPVSEHADDAALAAVSDSEKKDALERARALNGRVVALHGQGKYVEAVPLAREVLALCEKALGKSHPGVAKCLNQLAVLLDDQGAYAEAKPLFERALAINVKALGKDHPDVATSLSNLAGLFEHQGAYADAKPLYELAIAIDEKVLGKDHPGVATALNDLAMLLKAQGAYAEAKPLFERALAIYEKAFGREHRDVARTLSNLAVLLQAEGAYTEARRLLERALAIDEKAFGEDHPDVATGLNNLAVLLQAQGAYAEARPLLERALAMNEKALGKDHPDVATSLTNTATLLEHQGAYAEAKPLLERALAIYETALGKDHPDVANGLNNLASLLIDQDAYADAKPLYERALAIYEKALGKDHPRVALSLNNLAGLLQAQRAYAEARRLYERALGVYEKALGKDHPDVARSLNNLASLLIEQGAYAEAKPLLEHALAINVKALGEDHPDVAMSLTNLAWLLEHQGANAEAKPHYDRALALTERHARIQFAALGASERRDLLRTTRYQLDSWLRFAPRVGLSGYPEVLRFKGLVARAETAERILSRHASGEDRSSQEYLRAAERRVARLANQIATSLASDAPRARWQMQYAEAAAERERLTLELTHRMAPFRTSLERLDLGLNDVQAQVRSDTALVDVLRVGDRYLAWVVRSAGEPVRVDVGGVEPIESACAAFVAAIIHEHTDREKAGAALKALVWAPIEAKLGEGVKNVVLCPDAALSALPFAALPGREPGRYLIEELALSYVMAAQDMVPWKDATPFGTGAILVGAVDYDHATAGAEGTSPLARPEVLESLDRAPRGGTFSPLLETRAEIEALRDRVGRDAATVLLGADATEARFREGVKGRRLVHVATHGFAREDLLRGLYDRKIGEAFTSAAMERKLSQGHDPLLLSGLAMAGANPRAGGGGDDGILTALEASYLDLDGVDLVALSACETAKGTAESGEGVEGLVEGFQMAGARNLVASLWRVDDEATRRLMERFYDGLLRKEKPLSPPEALREAALWLRDSKPGGKDYSTPRYWAAFVAYTKR